MLMVMFGIHTMLAAAYETGTYGAGAYNAVESNNNSGGASGSSAEMLTWLVIGLGMVIAALLIFIAILWRRSRQNEPIATIQPSVSVDGVTDSRVMPSTPHGYALNESSPYCNRPDCPYDYAHFVH
jgi:hypothetical protein